MNKHTPGPWTAWINASNKHGDITSHKYTIAKVDCRYGAIGEPEANARLIAAAPLLLEAAQKALDECVDLIATDAGNALEAAIAKATGK